MSVIDEKQLVSECAANNMVAQKKLYDLYVGKLYMICMRYADNKDDAKDLLQDTFIKIYDNIKKFRGEGSLEGWMKRIAANTAIKQYHKKHLMYPVSIENINEQAPEEENFIEKVASGFSMNELLEMVHQLAPRYRLVFNLYAIDGYSHTEIAKELNISEGTSKSQLSRAREVLRNQIIEKQKIKTQDHVSTKR